MNFMNRITLLSVLGIIIGINRIETASNTDAPSEPKAETSSVDDDAEESKENEINKKIEKFIDTNLMLKIIDKSFNLNQKRSFIRHKFNSFNIKNHENHAEYLKKSETSEMDYEMHYKYFKSVATYSTSLNELISILNAKYIALIYVRNFIRGSFYFLKEHEQDDAKTCKIMAYYFLWFAELFTENILDRIEKIIDINVPCMAETFSRIPDIFESYFNDMMLKLSAIDFRMGDETFVREENEFGEKRSSIENYDYVSEWASEGNSEKQLEELFSAFFSEKRLPFEEADHETNLKLWLSAPDLIKNIKNLNPAVPKPNLEDKNRAINAIRSNVVEMIREIELKKLIWITSSRESDIRQLMVANSDIYLTLMPGILQTCPIHFTNISLSQTVKYNFNEMSPLNSRPIIKLGDDLID